MSDLPFASVSKGSTRVRPRTHRSDRRRPDRPVVRSGPAADRVPVSSTRRLHDLARALVLVLVLLGALLGTARPAGAAFFGLSNCVPENFASGDPRGSYYPSGNGRFGWDGSALTIASTQ